MNYFWLYHKDLRDNNWLFYNETIENGWSLRIRERYAKLRCSKCKKFDEIKALKLGLEDNIKLKCKYDIFITDDGFICVNQKVKKLLEKLKVKNIKFINIPNEKQFSILLPKKEAKVDMKKCGMKFYKLCKSCGRYGYTLYNPLLSSIKLPKSLMQMVFPNINFENGYGRIYIYLLSEDLVNKFKAAKVTGVEYDKAR